MARKFPLRIELVPEPLWGQNLRSNQVGLGPTPSARSATRYSIGVERRC